MRLPLDVALSNPLRGGYAFLAITNDGVTPHPGVDLNSGATADADCGTAVVAGVHGWVSFVGPWDKKTTGFGNQIWIKMDDDDPNGDPATFGNVPSHAHYCHLSSISVKEGQEVSPDTPIGTCGKTGNWEHCHLHFEIMRHAPPTNEYWPKGATPTWVQTHYHNPLTYLAVYKPKSTISRSAPAPGAPALAPAPALGPTLAEVLDSLRHANWQKHEMEKYIVNARHRKEVDDEAARQGVEPIVLMLGWARQHYKDGEWAP